MIALYVLSLGWFVIAAVLAFALSKQADRHAEERADWAAQRRLLDALRAPRPVPSARRPEPALIDHAAKLHALKKAARPAALDALPEPGVIIVPTDL